MRAVGSVQVEIADTTLHASRCQIQIAGRIIVDNPRFVRSAQRKVVLLIDDKFNKGAPTARDADRLNYNRRGDGSVKYGSRILYGRDMNKSGTLRSTCILPSSGSFDVEYVIIGPGMRRMLNRLPVTIPTSDADLPRE